jgi:hypothetical protein
MVRVQHRQARRIKHIDCARDLFLDIADCNGRIFAISCYAYGGVALHVHCAQDLLGCFAQWLRHGSSGIFNRPFNGTTFLPPDGLTRQLACQKIDET